MQPKIKLFNFELVNKWISLDNLDENKAFKLNLIRYNEKRNKRKPQIIKIKNKFEVSLNILKYI